MTATSDFARAIADEGLGDPMIIPDGRLHRYRGPGDKPGAKNCWYVFHESGTTPAGAFGSWRLGFTQTWSSKGKDRMTPADRANVRRLVESAKRQREQEQAARHARAAQTVRMVWPACSPAPADHPYLLAKGITPHCARLDGLGSLVIPVGDWATITSMQFIRPDGGKRFLSGGRIYGCFCLLPGTKPAPILICEGFATGATLVEQTGSTCVVAFNAGNLLPVAKAVRAQHPKADIIVCGDNDAWTEGNPGATKARAAALEIGAQLLLPDFTGLDLSEKPTDFNDLARLRNASARRAA